MEHTAPFLRNDDRVSRHNNDILIALAFTLVMPMMYYGWRPLIMVLLGIVSAVVCECIGCLLMHRRPTVLDGSAAASGALIGALMSPLCPFWMPIIGAAFAVWVVKLPFGGMGQYLFSPAAAALAVLTQCWSHQLFTYPVLYTKLPLTMTVPMDTVVTETSPAGQLFAGAYTVHDGMSLLMGTLVGPISATGVLVLIAAAVYLFVRHSAFVSVTLPYVAACTLMAMLFPRVEGAWYTSVLMELGSGYLLFVGVFMLASCVTPRCRLGRMIYGTLAGVLVMLMRYYGQFEEGACFAVLLVNALAPLIDRYGWRVQAFWMRRRERREVMSL